MSKHSSRHSQPKSRSGPLPYAAAMLLGAGAAGVAWVYLVTAAVDFGDLALAGGPPIAWAFTLAPAVGAVLCALLVLTLVAKALVALGVISDYKPRRAAGRRRAG